MVYNTFPKSNSKSRVIHIIGFPKSGNTWLARLMSDILNSRIDAKPHELVNNVTNYDKPSESNYLIKKVHWVNYDNLKDLEIIYIIRDIRDVLISAFFHNNRGIKISDIECSWFLQKYFNYEIKALNQRWQGNPLIRMKSLMSFKGRSGARIGGWSEHVYKWTNLSNITIVRYEDLLENPFDVLRKILREKNIHVNSCNIEQAIEKNSFKSMKELFKKQNDLYNYKFLRKGKSGDWSNILTQDLLKK